MFFKADFASGSGESEEMQVVSGRIETSDWVGWSGQYSANATVTVDVGLRPKYLIWFNWYGNYTVIGRYDYTKDTYTEVVSTTQYNDIAVGDSSPAWNYLNELTDTGFQLKGAHGTTGSGYLEYWAFA